MCGLLKELLCSQRVGFLRGHTRDFLCGQKRDLIVSPHRRATPSYVTRHEGFCVTTQEIACLAKQEQYFDIQEMVVIHILGRDHFDFQKCGKNAFPSLINK